MCIQCSLVPVVDSLNVSSTYQYGLVYQWMRVINAWQGRKIVCARATTENNRSIWMYIWNFYQYMYISFECWKIRFDSKENIYWRHIQFCTQKKETKEELRKMPTFYKAEINKTEWEVPDRYQMLSPVGSGAYGQVWWVSLNILPPEMLYR